MTRVVRHPPGKERPRNAPMATLAPRRAGSWARRGFVGHWHRLTVRLEARRGTTRPRKWRRWISYTNVTRAVWIVAALALLAWAVQGLYIVIAGKTTRFEQWRQDSQGFESVMRFVGPVLGASIAATLFLFWWYRWTKRRYLAKARDDPHRLVLTAGPDTAEIVGREEIAQVIAERLRERDTRRPYLLVGGVGVGKTAVLVRLTELLAEQNAVPVPIRLRDATGDLNFERMARQRFAEEAPRGILARSKTDRVWQQLLADDKPVVIADGLEEALLGDGLQQNRDNIIRRAIERAHAEKLPLVIASRPHSPLESTPAAIVELEPLSEEEALRFVQARVPETDERRVDWIVETAEVTESPVYLQIARELHRHGALEHDRPDDDPQHMNTRSRDRGTLRLWLLQTWDEALCEGRLREDVTLSRQERRDTLEVVSALACVGLLQDRLEVGFGELLDTDVHPGPVRRAQARAEHLWTSGRGFDRYGRRGNVFSEWHRQQIWDVLCRRLGPEERRRLRRGNMDQCRAALARIARNADKLGLVEGFERRVRFPHSIIQAYFGYRVLNHLGERGAGELVEQALQPPGPSRELLMALVLLSRRRAAALRAPRDGVRAEARSEIEELLRRSPVGGHSLAHRLCTAARRRTDDPKALDLYTAAVEIESVEEIPRLLDDITGEVRKRWTGFKGDRRTLDDAKLRLLRQLGAALRSVSARIDTTPLYEDLVEIGIAEPSYSIRLAAAQEFGTGGNAAFAVIRGRVGLNSDPVKEYNDRLAELKAWKRQEYERWAERMSRARAAGAPSRARSERIGRLQQDRRRLNQDYRRKRVDLFREFVMRAWMIPMLLGSVDEAHRDEVRERLTKWLRHLDPNATDGAPDLPLALEAALAQGFKYAANRRKRHPDAYPAGRADLIRQAETVLQQSRCWYAQVILLQALCLWELPDTAGAHERGAHARSGKDGGDGAREPSRAMGGTTAIQTVQRWLSMAGTVNRAPGPSGGNGDAPRRLLHPFVAEAGDLVALALETGQPERFLWIDEKGVADNIGARTGNSEAYRKHNLWIPPSVGWSTLDARAQRLVADVLVMLNLIDRDGHPDEVEERMARVEQPGMPLPPCIRSDRGPLRPGLRAGISDPPTPGSTCLPDCKFQLCPYPPRGCVPRGEIREPFCRQQQALLPGRVRRHLPRGLRRKTPHWVSMRVTELDGFWQRMAGRTRS
ncbi:NACHT domain-containing protein [Streptomyces sp. AS02]|uniref:NACHT domain-containing protein n=1 Tax=Streptomyces sp. AS02 TaxID=2938946 RepID=UPI00202126B8|nr:NACHT domain-containing protein [Streptomyces sp. AS02]MCL8015346.1 NACHT domain-containing protein [Streptomyces sp. AS02]